MSCFAQWERKASLKNKYKFCTHKSEYLCLNGGLFGRRENIKECSECSCVGDASQFRGAVCVGCKEFFLCLAIQHSHAVTSEWRINVFRTPGAKAVTVWSLGLISDREQKDLGVQRQQA